MSKQKKWKIKGIKKEKNLFNISRIVISQRINTLLSTINDFFSNDSVENLHEVRISLRRLRYNLEIFDSCFDKRKFLSLYKNIASLQDITGNKRDLDVLQENISKLYSKEKIEIAKELIIKIDEQKNKINEKLKLELLKFIHSDILNEFKNLLE